MSQFVQKIQHLFAKNKLNENEFILGLDLGRDSSHLAFMNPVTKTPEIIDLSGGYGKTSVPTMIQFLPDSNEWVFGEYAALNQGMNPSITIHDLISPLGKTEYMAIGDRTYSVTRLLSLFITNLVAFTKNINPKAVIKGISVAIPTDFSEESKEDLIKAIGLAGFQSKWLGFTDNRKAIFNYIFYTKAADNPFHKLLVLDLGADSFRSYLYANKLNEGSIECLSTLFTTDLGMATLDAHMLALITKIYTAGIKEKEISETDKKQLQSFLYQYKDLLFQTVVSQRPVKLYFNFAYPPFQQEIKVADILAITEPFMLQTADFINQLIAQSLEPTQIADIDMVFVTGGGFEMQWVREGVERLFPLASVVSSKQTKASIAKGTAIEAAIQLGFIKQNPYTIIDVHQLEYDIGIVLNQNKTFIPVAEKNSFWWQDRNPLLFLVNEAVNGPLTIPLYRLGVGKELIPLADLQIHGLPARPKGGTRLSLHIDFIEHQKIRITVTDNGFGELFPVTDFKQQIDIDLLKEVEYVN